MCFFFFNDTATTEIYTYLPTLSLHDALPISFITAWNPQARRRPPAENLAAQHELLAALQNQPGVTVYPAIGVGSTGWIEPSLFAIGADVDTLDILAREHAQLAYVHGQADGVAHLRPLD